MLLILQKTWPRFLNVKTFICLVGVLLVSAATAVRSQDGGVGGGIVIRAVATNYKGPCPVVVHFQGTIYHTLSHIKVRYHWERNGRKTTTQNSGELLGGKLDVSDDFSVGTPGRAFIATDRLYVSIEGEKKNVASPKVESTGTCTP
jgi:hypothetical protein